MRIFLVLGGALLMSACGGTAAAPAAAPTTPVAATSAPAPATGPFRVKVTHCGRYTPAERAELATNATSGLIATVTNTGSPAEMQLSVNFTDGSMVQDNNTSGFTPILDSGQSAVVSVDNLYGAGLDGNPADRCAPVGYAAQTADATLIGTWPLPARSPE